MTERVVVTGGSGFIGRNLINTLSGDGTELYNIDIRAQPQEMANCRWIQCDILDKLQLISALRQIDPGKIIHLAARTDSDGESLDDYRVNTVGTQNLIEAMQACRRLERAIFTSTQFVVGPGSLPEHDEDFRPHTIYGDSKVRMEQSVRQSNLACAWTIVRPTNVWGPWHPRYPSEFWRVLKKGRYLHPGRRPVIRSYAYVGNVVFQIQKILEAECADIDRRVFYLGDAPVDLYRWTSAFSQALLGKGPRVVPRGLVKALAIVGDRVTRLGGRFPLTSSRYRSMTVDYPTPVASTISTFGQAPYRLEDGVEETVRWLRSQDEFWH